MKNKKILIMVATVLLVGVIGVVGFTFARYQSTATSTPAPKVAKWKVSVGGQNISDGTTKTFTTNINWDNNPNISGNGQNLIAPGSEGNISFDIDTTGSQVAVDYVFSVDTKDLINHNQIKITKATVTPKNNDGEETQLLGLGTYSGTISLKHIEEPVTVKVYIEWDPYVNNEDDTNLGATSVPINLPITVTVSQHTTDTLAYAILKNAILLGNTEEGRTKFNKPEGMLLTAGGEQSEKTLNAIEDDYGVSYYYRGHVQDNFVNFAGKCWRIVRIQGDGSIKIVLDDKDHECQNVEGTKSTTFEGNEIAGSIGQGNASIGSAVYGYTGNGSSSNPYRFDYENNADGSNNGAKKTIDDWINSTENISEDDQSKLKEEDWCLGNQNKWYKYSTWEETTDFGSYAYSESYKKIYKDETYDLKCGEESNRVTDKGGLLTAEEVALTGPFRNSEGWKSYLWIDYNKGGNWWLATPASRGSSGGDAFFVYGSYLSNYYVSDTYAVRPAVVLSSMIKLTGGDGTHENPYTV